MNFYIQPHHALCEVMAFLQKDSWEEGLGGSSKMTTPQARIFSSCLNRLVLPSLDLSVLPFIYENY